MEADLCSVLEWWRTSWPIPKFVCAKFLLWYFSHSTAAKIIIIFFWEICVASKYTNLLTYHYNEPKPSTLWSHKWSFTPIMSKIQLPHLHHFSTCTTMLFLLNSRERDQDECHITVTVFIFVYQLLHKCKPYEFNIKILTIIKP